MRAIPNSRIFMIISLLSTASYLVQAEPTSSTGESIGRITFTGKIVEGPCKINNIPTSNPNNVKVSVNDCGSPIHLQADNTMGSIPLTLLVRNNVKATGKQKALIQYLEQHSQHTFTINFPKNSEDETITLNYD